MADSKLTGRLLRFPQQRSHRTGIEARAIYNWRQRGEWPRTARILSFQTEDFALRACEEKLASEQARSEAAPEEA